MHIAKKFYTACIISKVPEGCFETLHVSLQTNDIVMVLYITYHK